jgi:plasmid stability protein
MSQLLVRDLDLHTIERLKARARSHGRSLQKEVKTILEEAATSLTMAEARQVAARWRRRLGGRKSSDSAELIREDRGR